MRWLWMTIFLFSQALYAADFRNSYWGDSIDEVLKAEGGKVFEENDDSIVIEDTIAGVDVYAAYYFEQDVLYNGIYISNEKHISAERHINDYIKINELLEKKYGEPVDEGVYWDNDFFKDNPDLAGMALKTESLEMEATWETDTTEIYTRLMSSDGKIVHAVRYTDKSQKDRIAIERERESMDKL